MWGLKIAVSVVLTVHLGLATARDVIGDPVRSKGSETFHTPAGFYPESIALDPISGDLYLTSFRLGMIGRVDRHGHFATVVDDPDLVSSSGIKVDATRKRLLICITDVGAATRSSASTNGNTARLVEYAMPGGQRLRTTDLAGLAPGPHNANDVGIDADGNAYVTDSSAGVIYRAPLNGPPSVLASNAAWRGPGVNLNGIAVHPDGYLLVGQYNAGALWRVALSAPHSITRVRMPSHVTGADGILLLSRNRLAIVRNSIGLDTSKPAVNRVELWASSDDWHSAHRLQVTQSLDAPTAITGSVTHSVVLESRLNELFSHDGVDARANADVYRVRFLSWPG